MAKSYTLLSMTLLVAGLLAAGPGWCCPSNPGASDDSHPCGRHSPSTSPKGTFDGCCPLLGKSCGCDAREMTAVLQVPSVPRGEKAPVPSAAVALPFGLTPMERTSVLGAPPSVPSRRAPGVPLYLLHGSFLL